jgi:hypothetical protein
VGTFVYANCRLYKLQLYVTLQRTDGSDILLSNIWHTYVTYHTNNRRLVDHVDKLLCYFHCDSRLCLDGTRPQMRCACNQRMLHQSRVCRRLLLTKYASNAVFSLNEIHAERAQEICMQIFFWLTTTLGTDVRALLFLQPKEKTDYLYFSVIFLARCFRVIFARLQLIKTVFEKLNRTFTANRQCFTCKLFRKLTYCSLYNLRASAWILSVWWT